MQAVSASLLGTGIESAGVPGTRPSQLLSSAHGQRARAAVAPAGKRQLPNPAAGPAQACPTKTLPAHLHIRGQVVGQVAGAAQVDHLQTGKEGKAGRGCTVRRGRNCALPGQLETLEPII